MTTALVHQHLPCGDKHQRACRSFLRIHARVQGPHSEEPSSNWIPLSVLSHQIHIVRPQSNHHGRIPKNLGNAFPVQPLCFDEGILTFDQQRYLDSFSACSSGPGGPMRERCLNDGNQYPFELGDFIPQRLQQLGRQNVQHAAVMRPGILGLRPPRGCELPWGRP